MIIYTIILMALGISSIAFRAGEGNDKMVAIAAIDFIIMLPIFGRILGWW